MLLHTGPTTPFGRMVEVLAIEAGLALERHVIAVTEAEFLDEINPLRLIPTLVADDGTAIYDSRVICRHLASLAPDRGFYPAGLDTAFETRLALVCGIMDAGVARQGELARPQALRSAGAMAVYERRIVNGIKRLEADAEILREADIRLDAIAAAVLLDYIDFRVTRDWRQDAPGLSAWMEEAGRTPAMAATRFGR